MQRSWDGPNLGARWFIRVRVSLFACSEKKWVLEFERTLTMQASFSELADAAKKRVTRRDRFLSDIDAVGTGRRD